LISASSSPQGLEHLSKERPHLFLAINPGHRSWIRPFVKPTPFTTRASTPHAIGDNCCNGFVSDLMRLNKSLIVHRSVSGRVKVAVFLSSC